MSTVGSPGCFYTQTSNNRVDSSVTGQRDGKERRKMMMMKTAHSRTDTVLRTVTEKRERKEKKVRVDEKVKQDKKKKSESGEDKTIAVQ